MNINLLGQEWPRGTIFLLLLKTLRNPIYYGPPPLIQNLSEKINRNNR
jgi:hypothetical protein